MLGKKLIFVELNEVPGRVLADYAGRHPRSAIATLLARGTTCKTHACGTGHLSPWVTWPTLHRGVSAERHGLFNLGQDTAEVDAVYPPVWQLLARAGHSVGVFGPLHSYPLPPNPEQYAFYLPDTFAAGAEAHPAGLSSFQAFNLAMIDQNGRNVSHGLARGAVRFAARAPSLGVRMSTAVKLGGQLIQERLRPAMVVRRRSMQAVVSFDLFLRGLKRTRPDCAFFFTNHVASSLHRYWPALYPEDYDQCWWSTEWIRTYKKEISFALRQADNMLADLLEFVKVQPEYALIVAGSMGQAANSDSNMRVERQLLLRHHDVLRQALGVSSWIRQRHMEPLYTFIVPDTAERIKAREALMGLSVCGQPIRTELAGDALTFELGQTNLADPVIRFMDTETAPEKLGIVNVAIQDEVGSAAGHVPEGNMILFDPTDPIELPREMPITAIAPMLLRNFGVAVPDHMLH